MQFLKKNVEYQGCQRWLGKGPKERASFDLGATAGVGLSVDEPQDVNLVLAEGVLREDKPIIRVRFVAARLTNCSCIAA